MQLRVRRHLAAVQQWGGSAPRLVFLASDARHRSDFASQNDKHVVNFNRKMVRPSLSLRTVAPRPSPNTAATRDSHTHTLLSRHPCAPFFRGTPLQQALAPLSPSSHLGRQSTGVSMRIVTRAGNGRCSSRSTH